MAKLYLDLGKTAKKLLKDDYLCDVKMVELKTTTLNGMTYTTSGTLSGKSSDLSGVLSCKYTLSGAAMTTKLTTQGALTHQMVVENTGVKGLSLTLLGGAGPKQTIVATGEYVHPHMTAVVMANLLGNPSVISSFSVGMHGLTAGLETNFNPEKREFENVNGTLNYSSGKEHEATLQLLDKGKNAKFTYSHVITPDFSVAAEFDYGINDEKKVLTMGTKYLVDSETTLKTKLDSAGSVWLSYAQEIRKNTTLTLCTKFDARNLDKPTQQLGLSLAIE